MTDVDIIYELEKVENRYKDKMFPIGELNIYLMAKSCKYKIQDLQQENQNLKEKLELSEKARKEAIEYIKDSSLEVNTREYGNLTVVNSDDVMDILDIDKGE